ncbi:MAG: hypothetical protein FJW63_10650 [Actinobacteria bacterium]|nr:hypothetical protein [Actinomycetota bacterium]
MHKNHFIEFIKRLWKKTWVLVTGVVGFLVVFIFDLYFPHLNIPLFVYPIIFITSLTIGGFLIFREISIQNSELEERICELENRKPKINVGFPDDKIEISKNKYLHLEPITTKFDPYSQMEEKKKELEEKLINFQREKDKEGLLKLSSLMKKENLNYVNEVRDYLHLYPEYLRKIHECSIKRAFEIPIIVENIGYTPLNNLKIEFIMPDEYKVPEEHQCFDRNKTPLTEIISSIDHIREPEPYIDISRFGLDVPIINLNQSFNPIINIEEKIEGPINEVRNKKKKIVYKINKLIQHNPERNIDPFWIWLGDIHHDVRWEIQVRLTCEELLDPIFDIVYINIKIKQ